MPDASAPWRNRIVGEGEKPAAQFLAHPLNWRSHTPEQAAAMDAVLEQVGWVQRVIENVRTGHVLDGHLRIERALKRGDTTPIPFVQVDLSEDEERLVLATYDPLASRHSGAGRGGRQLVEGLGTHGIRPDGGDRELHRGGSPSMSDVRPQTAQGPTALRLILVVDSRLTATLAELQAAHAALQAGAPYLALPEGVSVRLVHG